MIYIKSEYDISQIKLAADIWKKIKIELIKQTKPGISLLQLDKIANTIAIENKATCSFYQYQGFEGHICISVNEQLIHGVPNNYIIKKGDLVTFDVGVTYNNYICDAAFSVLVEPISENAQRIYDATLDCLQKALEQIKPDNYTGDISYAIELCAKKHGFEVIKDYGGHGCGIKIHEDPIILNYGQQKTGAKLKPGMIICIEPMLLTKSDQYKIDTNGWTVIAKNNKLTCHAEYMVLVTKTGYENLTA